MKRRLKTILYFARPHKCKFVALFACILITSFLGSTFPYIFGRLVDEVFYGKNMSAFLNIIIIYAVVYVFNQLMHFGLNMAWAQLMTEFLFDIKAAVLKKGLSFRGEKLAGGYSGDMVSRMGGDVDQFMDFIHWNVFYYIGSMISLILAIAFMWYLNMWIALFTICLTPLIVYLSRWFSKRAKRFYAEIAKQNGFLSSWLFEIIRGMQDIRLLGAVRHILSDYTRKTIKILRIQIKSEIVEVTSERVNSGVSLLAQLILYSISAIFILNDQLTVGGFTACVSYFGQCTAYFNSINDKTVNRARNFASIDRVCEVFEEESENYNENAPYISIRNGDVKFTDVHFSYNDQIEVLSGINLHINAGEKVSLVGHSGAGKTTIANLLYKLYTVQSGTISIDGTSIDDFNLHNLRSQIGIVHQDSIYFDGSVRFNLCFSDDKKNDDRLWQSLHMAHLADFVKSLPNGLDTLVGEGGIAFSGGQKQRLAIARIFVKNPKILIFDEATSSLDSEAESVIKSSWDELCAGRTILIIAHRFSTIINSNRVAVIKDGKIAGIDKHTALLENCPEYRELFHEQFSKEEIISV